VIIEKPGRGGKKKTNDSLRGGSSVGRKKKSIGGEYQKDRKVPHGDTLSLRLEVGESVKGGDSWSEKG